MPNVRPVFHVRTPASEAADLEALRRDIEENLNRIYQGANQGTDELLAAPSLHSQAGEVEELRRVAEHELGQVVRLVNERREKGTAVTFKPPSLRMPPGTPALEELRHAAEVEMGYLCRQLNQER